MYHEGDEKILYEVSCGYLDDGMRAHPVDVYATIDDAVRAYDDIDIRQEWLLEYGCSNGRSKEPVSKSITRYIYRFDGEQWQPWDQPVDDMVRFEQYGFEDFKAEGN